MKLKAAGRFVLRLTRQIPHLTYAYRQDLHNHVVTQTAQAFITSFLTRCVRVHLDHQNQVDGDGDRAPVPRLDVARVLPRYKHSRKRLLLIDLEGTLWVRDPRSLAFDPPADAVKLLKDLAEDERNEVWLLSGLQVGGALDGIAKAVPKIGLW